MTSVLARLADRIQNRTPVPFTGDSASLLSLPSSTGGSGKKRLLNQMAQSGILFPIISAIGEGVSSVDWKLWREAPSGAVEDRIPVTSHAALDLWSKPNPFMPRGEFVETFSQHVELVGEGWWVLARDRRSPLPLEIWPVRPDRMKVVESATDFISGYVYQSPGGEKVPLKVEDVIQIRLPNPVDPYRGLGPVQSLLMDLDSVRYSAEWNRNFFLNSAEPGGIIEFAETMSDAEFDTFSTRWQRQHRGVSRAHRVAVLERGTWKDRSYSHRDMRFIELRQTSDEAVRRAFRFPKPMLGDTEDSNRAVAVAAEVMFSRWILTPRLVRIRSALNELLLPVYGDDRLVFDFADPTPVDTEETRMDRDSRVRAAVELVGAGFDSGDVLEFLDLPDLRFSPVTIPATAATPLVVEALASPTPIKALAARDDESIPDSLLRVRSDYEAALARTMARWDVVVQLQRSELVEQVVAAVDADDENALTSVAASWADGADILAEEMLALAIRASARMVEEAAAQGVTLEPFVTDISDVRRSAIQARRTARKLLADRAKSLAKMLAAGLALSTVGEALRWWRGDRTGVEVGVEVRTHLESLTDATLKERLGSGLWTATAVARIETMRSGPLATYVASEQLDDGTCSPCSSVSGRVFASLSEAEGLYGGGGYVGCQGRDRCRGTIIPQW